MARTRQKHNPQRTCVACRQKFDRQALTRIVYTDTGLVIDTAGKRSGRGAYLCDTPACWQRASQTNILSQALRTPLSDEDRTVLTTDQSNPS